MRRTFSKILDFELSLNKVFVIEMVFFNQSVSCAAWCGGPLLCSARSPLCGALPAARRLNQIKNKFLVGFMPLPVLQWRLSMTLVSLS